MTAISVSERLLEMAAFYTPLALTVTKKYRARQGNGKLAALTSGRPAFQQHAEHAEGSNTTPTSHTRKTMSAGCTNPDFGRNEKDYAAQRGRDASEQRRA